MSLTRLRSLGWASALALTLSLTACDSASERPLPPGAASASEAGGLVDPASVRVSRADYATNQKLAEVSRAIAHVLDDDDVRAYVYGRAVQRFDGETNVLWDALEAADGPDGFGTGGEQGAAFSSLLVQRAPDAFGAEPLTPREINEVVDAAGRALGGPLHLFWVNADEVGPEEAPLVTFTPVGIDPDDIEELVAYDAAGVEHVVNEAVAARRPVVALAHNERVTEAQVAEMRAAGFPASIIIGGGGGGGGGGNSDTQAGSPDPMTPGQARLDYIKLYHDYENFVAGGPEIRLTITSFNAAMDTTNASTRHDIWQSHYIDDSWVDGRKILVGKNLLPWDTDDNPTLSMKWTEVDGSLPTSNNFGIDDAEFNLPTWAEVGVRVVDYFIKKANEDEDLGYADVNFESDLTMYYGLGNPDFQVSRNP